MTYQPVKQPYIQTSKSFPLEPEELQAVLTKAYTEIALAMNARVIGIFDRFQATTGERWFNDVETNERRQGYRRIYTGTGTPANFDHGVSGITEVIRIFGSATTSTGWIPLPYVHPTAANQIGVEVSPTQVIFNVGGTAPAITDWFVDLEYLLV